MGAIADIWRSERGLLAITIIFAASVLAALGVMPVENWQTFVMVVFGTYTAGKTITSVTETIKGTNGVAPTPAPAPAPTPAPPTPTP